MKTIPLFTLLAAAVVLCNAGFAAEPSASEQEAQREARIKWFRDARFGMFIHWGLYSIPGGTWKTNVHATGYSEWIMFDEKIPVKEYAKLAGGFNPVKFDAREWVATAKKAGMRYMVLTTKHHDGFSMFKSKLTSYNIVDATPFKRDVTGELADACRKAGLKFGCYYSVDRDWYRPLGPGNRYGQNNRWDYPDSPQEDFNKYFTEFAKPQVEELLKDYRADLLWFDGIDMMNNDQLQQLYSGIRKLAPDCVINSRIKGCRPPDRIPPPLCDYISTGDNEIAGKAMGFEWENPGTMNTSYGFNRNDHNWVAAKEIIFRLVDIVSKGGNYLLYVGPTSEGLIPQPSIDRLMEVGAWMDINGEAIYGTSVWKVHGEESTPLKDGKKADDVDIRFTTKGKVVYAICLGWPEKKNLMTSIGRKGTPAVEISAVRMLGSKAEINWQQTEEGLALSVPREQPCQHAFVYKIELR